MGRIDREKEYGADDIYCGYGGYVAATVERRRYEARDGGGYDWGYVGIADMDIHFDTGVVLCDGKIPPKIKGKEIK